MGPIHCLRRLLLDQSGIGYMRSAGRERVVKKLRNVGAFVQKRQELCVRRGTIHGFEDGKVHTNGLRKGKEVVRGCH